MPPCWSNFCKADEAERWLLHAAEGGDAESMLTLAKRAFYAREFEEARVWGERAKEAGSVEAAELFRQLPR